MGQHRHKPSPYADTPRAQRNTRRADLSETPLGLLLGIGAAALLLGLLLGLVIPV